MKAHKRRGGALVVAMMTLIIITSTMAALVQALMADLRQTRQAALELQAHALADAALARAAAQVANNDYRGESWRAAPNPDDPTITGLAEIQITRAADNETAAQITVQVCYPDHPTRRVLVNRKLSLPAPHSTDGGNE